ncbi:MAG TPA: single-stranded DNA-binding protein [Candidatus Binataceae bacterium]|nr:single-stranded DNA-binding protein [Candidatus Binataceae bacterium]
MSLNRAMVIGYLGHDPETRFLPSGQAVVNFSIATDESYTDKNGEKQGRVEWHAVVAFARLGEICVEHLKKGRQVFVEGRLRTREYEAKSDGGKRQRTEIVASRVQFLGPPPNEKPTGAALDEQLVAADPDAPL